MTMNDRSNLVFRPIPSFQCICNTENWEWAWGQGYNNYYHGIANTYIESIPDYVYIICMTDLML